MGIAGAPAMGDYGYSSRFRDTIETLVTGVVDRLRPLDRVGKVYSINSVAQTAKILFPGGDITNLSTVRFASYLHPSVSMDATFNTDGYDAPGDVVRVSGRPGDYYISDFLVGTPRPRVVRAVDLDVSGALGGSVFTNRTLTAVAQVATTASHTLTGLAAVDGFSIQAGHRVLVHKQATASQNGIYIAASGAWTRASDWLTAVQIIATDIRIEYGTLYGGKVFRVNNWNGSKVVGTDAQDFGIVYADEGWKTYTPTLSGIPGSFSLSKYHRVGPECHVKLQFQASGTQTSAISITLPFTAANFVGGGSSLMPVNGIASGLRQGVGWLHGQTYLNSDNGVMAYSSNSGGTVWGNGGGFTWLSGDIFSFDFWYEVAP